MGKIDLEPLQGFSGQVGDLIVYGYGGNTYVRRKPKRVMRCDAVLEQQERIAGVAALYQAVKEGGLLPIWKKAAQGSGLTAYNWFVRANQKCFTKDGAVGDFGQLVLSVGELALPDRLELAPLGEGEWELRWENESIFPPCEGSDRLAVALVEDERGFVVKVPDIGDWQRKQRKVFPEMVEWSFALSAVLQVGLPSCPRKCTPENYFLTLNKQVAVADDDLSVAIDYSKLVISAGCRALPETANVTADAEARTLTFAFTEAEGYVAHSADDDLYYAVALETEKRRVKMEQLGARSGLESPMMNVPASWNMEALEVFVFVTSKDGKKASKTLYLPVE